MAHTVTTSRVSLVAQVTEELRARVCSGTWPVGSQIPTEPELVRMLAVGRNTVREAVQGLIHVGLLERRQGSGTYVTACSELAGLVANRLTGAEAAAGSAETVTSQAMEVRRAFEVEAARLAARRRTDADLAALDTALARLQSAGDLNGYAEADAALHQAVLRAAHNHLLADLYQHFGAALRTATAAHLCGDGRPDRRILVAAIRSRDSDAAAAAAAVPTPLPPPADPLPPPADLGETHKKCPVSA